MRLTFYVHGSAVNSELLTLLKTLKAEWVVVDDDADFSATRQLLEVVPRVVYMTSAYIRADWNTTGTKDYIEAMLNVKEKAVKAGVNSDDLWYGLLDKPRADKIESRRLSSWLSDVMTGLSRANMKLVVGNLDMNSVERWEVNNGYFDALLRAVANYTPGAVLGVCETTSVMFPYGAGYTDRWDLLEVSTSKIDKWPAQVHGQRNDLLRVAWLQDRARKLTVGDLPVLVAQLALGRTAALNGGQNTIYDTLYKRIGSPMKTIEGPYSLKDVWGFYWPELSFAEAYLRQLQWLESIYPSYIQGFALKSWGGIDQYDHSPDHDLHTLLIGDIIAPEIPSFPDIVIEGKDDTAVIPMGEGSSYHKAVVDTFASLLRSGELEIFPDDEGLEEDAWLAEIVDEEGYLESATAMDTHRVEPMDSNVWSWQSAVMTSLADFTNVRQYPSPQAPVVGHVAKETAILMDVSQAQEVEGVVWLPVRINLIGSSDLDFSNLGWVRGDAVVYRELYTSLAEDGSISMDRITVATVTYQENNQVHMALIQAMDKLLIAMEKAGLNIQIEDHSINDYIGSVADELLDDLENSISRHIQEARSDLGKEAESLVDAILNELDSENSDGR